MQARAGVPPAPGWVVVLTEEEYQLHDDFVSSRLIIGARKLQFTVMFIKLIILLFWFHGGSVGVFGFLSQR